MSYARYKKAACKEGEPMGYRFFKCRKWERIVHVWEGEVCSAYVLPRTVVRERFETWALRSGNAASMAFQWLTDEEMWD